MDFHVIVIVANIGVGGRRETSTDGRCNGDATLMQHTRHLLTLVYYCNDIVATTTIATIDAKSE